MRPQELEPGDVFSHCFQTRKQRPWLVLWVDDRAGTCLMAALTTSDYVGSFPVEGLKDGQRVGVWVTLQPTAALAETYRKVRLGRDVAAAARAGLREALDLLEDETEEP